MAVIYVISIFAIFTFSKCQSAEKIRGVNLGGWLVLEPWIVPSIFKQFESNPYNETAIDEFSFNLRLGAAEAQRQLEEHWSTWVQDEDFRKIKEYGLTHVRIPYGWWIFGDSPSYVHNISHLDRGLDLAAKYGIKVLLDLHGAPGSQNGFDNSGVVCKSVQYGNNPATYTQEDPEWSTNKTNLLLTTEILKKTALRYKDHPAVWGIEFVSGPYWDVDLDVLKQWYVDTYNVLRHLVPHWQMVMHDSFRPYSWFGFMQNTTEFFNVSLESHLYFAFDQNIYNMTEDQILQKSCDQAADMDFLVAKELPRFVGEWSLAVDDCAKYINGFHTRTRKKDMGLSCQNNFSKDFYRKMAQNQLWVFERSLGWMFWNFKNGLENDWSWFKMVELGWVPRDAHDIPEFINKSSCVVKQHFNKKQHFSNFLNINFFLKKKLFNFQSSKKNDILKTWKNF